LGWRHAFPFSAVTCHAWHLIDEFQRYQIAIPVLWKNIISQSKSLLIESAFGW